jgi:hypothetical protein
MVQCPGYEGWWKDCAALVPSSTDEIRRLAETAGVAAVLLIMFLLMAILLAVLFAGD